jgi:protein gp37
MPGGGVPFLFKQWGECFCGYDRDIEDPDWRRISEFAEKYPYPKGQWLNLAGGARIGKKAAGRKLDGREWNEFPR